MVSVQVSLISGRTVPVEAGLSEPVGAVKRRAQIALAVGRGRLLDASGGILDDRLTATRLFSGMSFFNLLVSGLLL